MGLGIRNLKEYEELLARGFRPYRGSVAPEVYERLRCDTSYRKPYWMSKWPLLYCLGCAKRCVPETPDGFQVVLPMTVPESARTPAPFSLTPRQLAESKELLRADEAAYCLNISRRHVYELAETGVLDKHNRSPWRVTAYSVLREMANVDS